MDCLMAKQDTNTEIKRDEFSKIFDEYRAKIEEITRRSERNLHSFEIKTEKDHVEEDEHIEVVTAQSQSSAATNSAIQTQLENVLFQKAETASTPEVIKNDDQNKAEFTPPPQAQPALKSEAVNTRIEREHPAIKESTEILNQARREAKQIIEEAEESAKKEAKKRTQSQVDKIIEKAKKEAEEIIARANKSADKVRDEVITESKREADLIIREITQKYRQDTEAQSSRIISEAQEKAGKMLTDVSASTTHVSQHITEIVNRAKQTVSDLETNLQAEVVELTKAITETQNKLEEVSKTVKVEKTLPPPLPKQSSSSVTNTNPTLAIRLIGEKTNGKNGTSPLFSGQMEMKSTSESFDYQYLKKLKKYLVHIPKIKYLQEYASEKEMSVVFDVLEPLPLIDILSNIPMVDEVIARADDDISLFFKISSD
jgi:vacuolar-type H+-ATPase subunit H